ncbi:hypothetical protein J2S03_003448 [Alicyclobacillus cycloheptanicus]|uniref:Uncharacterized protein n=1 Tax=Alicyclobacillus cycloheptanicus TaxID=1457 RepID=A0ABT9XMN8_9BACL|nr:hypothetical protein [Alicyclobacillus cycloheptanicus]
MEALHLDKMEAHPEKHQVITDEFNVLSNVLAALNMPRRYQFSKMTEENREKCWFFLEAMDDEAGQCR